jgi:hypothetical protein
MGIGSEKENREPTLYLSMNAMNLAQHGSLLIAHVLLFLTREIAPSSSKIPIAHAKPKFVIWMPPKTKRTIDT